MALLRLQPDGCGGGASSPDPEVVDSAVDASVDTDTGPKKPKPGDPCETRSDCDDGSFCTGVEECIAGLCTSARNAACRDPGGCAVATCDETFGACVFDAAKGSCPVGACRLDRGCEPLEGCTGDADPRCDDGRSCTDDICVAGRCEHLPIDGRCGAKGACGVGVCLGDAVADPTGCTAKPDAARCASGEGCGMDFACHALPASCTSDRDCADDNLCDGVERCVDHRCVHGLRTTCIPHDACEHASCSATGVGDPWCRLTKLARCP